MFLKTICALALRDLGSHPLPQEISATSARLVLRGRAWIWDGVEGENVDLRLYSGREHGCGVVLRDRIWIWDGIEGGREHGFEVQATVSR